MKSFDKNVPMVIRVSDVKNVSSSITIFAVLLFFCNNLFLR